MSYHDFKTTGKVKVDVEAFVNAAKERTYIEDPVLLQRACHDDSRFGGAFYTNGDNFFTRHTMYENEDQKEKARESYRHEAIEGGAKVLREVAEYLDRFGLDFNYFENVVVFKTFDDQTHWRHDEPYETTEMCLLGYGEYYFAIPPEFCAITLYESREDVPLGELRKTISGGEKTGDAELQSAGPQDHLTLRAARSAREAAEAEAKEIDAQIAAIKKGEHPEIQELHRQMEEAKKKFELMVAELSGNMVAQKSSLLLDVSAKMNTIEALDAMLYAVRCFEGEVVDFTCIKNGTPAAVDEPLVIYQTIRYLDEELGRHCSIYNLDFSGVKLFEDLLAAREDIVEIFCPNKKSICFIGNASTRRKYQVVDSVNGIFEMYQKYHADTIGILIRNGDKLFFGWTDEERIHVRDGKLFYSAGETVRAAEDATKNPWELDGELAERSWDMPAWFKDNKNVSYDDQRAIENDPDDEQRLGSFENYRQLTAAKIYKETHATEKVSRMFAFSIIEGVLKRTDMMELPEGESVSEAVRGKPSKYILFSMADAWLPENTYPSFTEYIEKYCGTNKEGDPILVMIGVTDGEFDSYGRQYRYNRSVDGLSRTNDAAVAGRTVQAINLIKDENIYVSAEKEWSRYGARANVKLYPTEYINITFMNSVWLEYVLRTRSAGGVRVSNAQFSFSDMIPYINVAKQWLEARERHAAGWLENIAPEILKDETWPIELSMWMFEKNVRLHSVSEYQAKRFAKHYLEKHKSRK